MSPKPSARPAKPAEPEKFVSIGYVNRLMICASVAAVGLNLSSDTIYDFTGFDIYYLILPFLIPLILIGTVLGFMDFFVLSRWLLSSKTRLTRRSKWGLTFVILGIAAFCCFGIYAIHP